MNYFKELVELRISENDFSALVKVMEVLREGKIPYTPIDGDVVGRPLPGKDGFNMRWWDTMEFLAETTEDFQVKKDQECGTCCCIGGWANKFGASFNQYRNNRNEMLDRLFYPDVEEAFDATPEQAAQAIENYLTHGDPLWEEVIR